ncbi:hypothetical protein ACP4OV_016629 [Aristida adscensionis]
MIEDSDLLSLAFGALLQMSSSQNEWSMQSTEKKACTLSPASISLVIDQAPMACMLLADGSSSDCCETQRWLDLPPCQSLGTRMSSLCVRDIFFVVLPLFCSPSDNTNQVNVFILPRSTPSLSSVAEYNIISTSSLIPTVSTFIVQKVLLHDAGLQYACATTDRYFSVAAVLEAMAISLVAKPSARLLNLVIGCYIRLLDNPWQDPYSTASWQLGLPGVLRNGTFDECLREDPETRQSLQQLLDNLSAGSAGEREKLAQLRIMLQVEAQLHRWRSLSLMFGRASSPSGFFVHGARETTFFCA